MDSTIHRGPAAATITDNLRNVGARVRLGHDGTPNGWIVLTPAETLIWEIEADTTPPPRVFVPCAVGAP